VVLLLLNKKVQEGRRLVQQWNSAARWPQHIIWARYSTSSTIPTQTQKDQQIRTTGWFFTKNNTEENIFFTIAAAQLPLMNLTWILSLFFFFFRIFTRMQSRKTLAESSTECQCLWFKAHALMSVTTRNSCSLCL
jgi:hypothetical protein